MRRDHPTTEVEGIRILLLSHVARDWNGGAASVTLNTADKLRKAGWSVRELYSDDLCGRNRNARLVILVIPFLVLLRGLYYAFVDAPSIIEASGPSGVLLFPALRLLRKARVLRKAPSLIMRAYGLEHLDDMALREEVRRGHETISWRYRLFYGGLILLEVRLAIRFADAVICHADEVKRYLMRKGWRTSTQVSVTSLGVPAEWLRSKSIQTDYALRLTVPPPGELRKLGLEGYGRDRSLANHESKSVLWCGSWIARKGVYYFVPAVSRFLTGQPDWRLTVCGSGRDKEFVLAQFPSSVRNRVRVVERLDRGSQYTLFREHAIFCFPSLSEGFGLALLEAMAVGLAVIATPTGIGADIVGRLNAGIVVNFRCPAEIYEALCRLASSKNTALEVAARAREVAQRYTWQRAAAEVADVYEALIGKA